MSSEHESKIERVVRFNGTCYLTGSYEAYVCAGYVKEVLGETPPCIKTTLSTKPTPGAVGFRSLGCAAVTLCDRVVRPVYSLLDSHIEILLNELGNKHSVLYFNMEAIDQ